MSSSTSYINSASRILNIPVPELTGIWANGRDISIDSMKDLEVTLCVKPKLFFMYDGIIREYFVKKNGSEHTVRILQGPAFIFPVLNNIHRAGEPPLISQSLTRLNGRVWDISFTPSDLFPSAISFKIGLKTIIEAVRIKVINDIRRKECSAQDRYQLFVKEYSSAVNQIPLKYIASYLNMTPETISRIRKRISQHQYDKD